MEKAALLLPAARGLTAKLLLQLSPPPSLSPCLSLSPSLLPLETERLQRVRGEDSLLKEKGQFVRAVEGEGREGRTPPSAASGRGCTNRRRSRQKSSPSPSPSSAFRAWGRWWSVGARRISLPPSSSSFPPAEDLRGVLRFQNPRSTGGTEALQPWSGLGAFCSAEDC